jgi:hypothetical protein
LAAVTSMPMAEKPSIRPALISRIWWEQNNFVRQKFTLPDTIRKISNPIRPVITMLKIYTAQHPTEAHLLRSILASFGIESLVLGEALFCARGALPITDETAPTVWLLDATRADEAARIIRDFEAPAPDKRESWRCGFCGEESEDQFTDCWNCGKSRNTET